MARPSAGKTRRFAGCGLAVALLALSGAARAEIAAAPPAAPAVSAQCAVPGADPSAGGPLPNLASALETGRIVHILAVGSPATVSLGAADSVKAYPAQLEAILESVLKGVDVEITNRSAAGEVAETTAERIKSEVAVAKPDLLLWQLGTNDALARVPPEDFEATVRDTVQWLKDNDVDVVLVGLQYTAQFAKDPSYYAILDALRRVAASDHILYVRRNEVMQFIETSRSAKEAGVADEARLANLGYRCMAEHVAHAVIANVFVRRVKPTTD
jgi:lysophospholipase L1-like esterase